MITLEELEVGQVYFHVEDKAALLLELINIEPDQVENNVYNLSFRELENGVLVYMYFSPDHKMLCELIKVPEASLKFYAAVLGAELPARPKKALKEPKTASKGEERGKAPSSLISRLKRKFRAFIRNWQ